MAKSLYNYQKIRDVYKHTDIEHDIRVFVNGGIMYQKRINTLLEEGKGILLTSAVTQAGIPRGYLLKLVEQGALEHTGRGVYIRAGGMDDQLYALQQSAKKIVYSHETALFFHGLTDRTPFTYSITVPSGYKPSEKLKSGCKIYFIKSDRINVGLTKVSSGMGHDITIYDMERTICDSIRSRSKLDIQIVTDALKRYASRKDKNLNVLGSYAEQFGIQKLLHHYLEVLL
ncbi:abortive infection protein [Spirochaetia bacterium]|nr:abortive infection protein [Spirochaetia bacterium]